MPKRDIAGSAVSGRRRRNGPSPVRSICCASAAPGTARPAVARPDRAADRRSLPSAASCPRRIAGRRRRRAATLNRLSARRQRMTSRSRSATASRISCASATARSSRMLDHRQLRAVEQVLGRRFAASADGKGRRSDDLRARSKAQAAIMAYAIPRSRGRKRSTKAIAVRDPAADRHILDDYVDGPSAARSTFCAFGDIHRGKPHVVDLMTRRDPGRCCARSASRPRGILRRRRQVAMTQHCNRRGTPRTTLSE